MVSWWEIWSGNDADLAGVVPGWIPMAPGELAMGAQEGPNNHLQVFRVEEDTATWRHRGTRCGYAEPAGDSHVGGENRTGKGIQREQHRARRLQVATILRDVEGREGRTGTWCQGTKVLLARLRSWAFHFFYKSWHREIAGKWLRK